MSETNPPPNERVNRRMRICFVILLLANSIVLAGVVTTSLESPTILMKACVPLAAGVLVLNAILFLVTKAE